MTVEEYKAVCARIDKAESLSADVMEDPYVRNAYHDLCDRACEYEMAQGGFAWHGIHDKIARRAAQKLVGTVLEINDHGGERGEQGKARMRGLLTDLMAFAVSASEDTLQIFGYKEVAENDGNDI